MIQYHIQSGTGNFKTNDLFDASKYYDKLPDAEKETCEFNATTFVLFGGQYIETKTETIK